VPQKLLNEAHNSKRWRGNLASVIVPLNMQLFPVYFVMAEIF